MTTPLSPAEFQQQVETLFDQHGAKAFAASAGESPKYTLFVEGDAVLAESAASPRHRYGAYCELDRPMDAASANDCARRWVNSGEAYELYLSMNVCRYGC